MKQIATRIQAVPVYRDGDREWSEQFPVTVYEDGEGALSSETALRWEIRHKHYLELAERGELPEPTARVERAAEAPPSGPPRVIGTRMKPVPVYEEGDRLWEEEFPATVYDDGYFGFDPAQVHQIEERRAHYAELADRGDLPEPTGRARPNPPAPKAPCVIATRTQSVPVYQEGNRLWQEEFPVLVYDDGEIGLEDAIIREWEVRHQYFLELAKRGELPKADGEPEKGSHEAAGG